LRPLPANLTSVSTADLRAALARGLTRTAGELAQLGMIWAELERRGEDLSELRREVGTSIPLIAAGVLAAEVVVAFAGRPSLWRALVGLPLERQRAIAGGEPLPLVVDAGEGEFAVRPLPAGALSTKQVRQLFGVGEVRGQDEQIAYLADLTTPSRPPRAKPAPPERHYRVRADPERGGLWIGNAFAAHAEIVAALADLAGPLSVLNLDQEHESATVRLSAAEKKKLKAAEKRRGLPEWHLIREALRACGLI
jgi:hypothetical protein